VKVLAVDLGLNFIKNYSAAGIFWQGSFMRKARDYCNAFGPSLLSRYWEFDRKTVYSHQILFPVQTYKLLNLCI
jgi:hypothetical protein